MHSPESALKEKELLDKLLQPVKASNMRDSCDEHVDRWADRPTDRQTDFSGTKNLNSNEGEIFLIFAGEEM